MKVLHVFKTYMTDSTGGVEKTIQQICLSTTKQGIKNQIFCLTRQPYADLQSCVEAEVFRYPTTFEVASTPISFASINGFKTLAAYADIIHYHFPWPFADLLHLLARPNKPTVLTYHSDIIRQQLALKLYRPMMHFFLEQMDCIVATSPQYLETSPTLQRFQKKTDVIPIGLDKSTYPAATADKLQYWRNQVGESFFLFVGVMRYYKGLSILLDACKNLSAKVVIVGSGPMEAELKEQAQRLNLTHVHFLGSISDEDKVALLTLCLSVIFPSHLRSEAFGVSLLEGAMFGKPLISTELGTGTCHVNIHGETGLAVSPANPAALRSAMEWMLSHPSEAADMGRRAQQRFFENFTSDLMAEKYMLLYEDLYNRGECKI